MKETAISSVEDPRHQAWDAAIYSFGTSKIFEARARSLKLKITCLKLSGIALPLLLGGFVVTFGGTWPYFEMLLYITGLVGVVQLIATAVSLVQGWDERYAEYKEAQIHNARLADQYSKLAKLPPNKSAFSQRFELLEVERSLREQQDMKVDLSDAERRYGMRRGLHQFQRPCATCNKVPNLHEPSTCDTCGN